MTDYTLEKFKIGAIEDFAISFIAKLIIKFMPTKNIIIEF